MLHTGTIVLGMVDNLQVPFLSCVLMLDAFLLHGMLCISISGSLAMWCTVPHLTDKLIGTGVSFDEEVCSPSNCI